MKNASKNTANTATPNNNLGISLDILSKIKIPRKFEIFVEEYDEEYGPGRTPAWRPVKADPMLGGNGGNPVITVNSQAELKEQQQFYSTVGQRFKIIREINPPSRETILKLAKEQGIEIPEIEQCQTQDVIAEQHNNESDTDQAIQPVIENKNDIPDKRISYDKKNENIMQSAPCQTNERKIKPKIITIGDLQIKYDGDKVYQKQWVKLSANEADNFRVVNDSNNKIVSLAGKHIEAKKWIIVEENTEYNEENADA